jgi:alcohol dehydrogenase
MSDPSKFEKRGYNCFNARTTGLMNQYGIKAIFLFSQVNRQRLTKLAQWVDQNNIKVNIDKTFPLDEAGKALDYQNGVHPRGKVILTV